MSHSAGRYQWSVSTHMLPGSIGVMTQAPLKVGGMYAVSPKKDCPHLTPEYLETDLAAYSAVTMTSPCTSCDNRGENWCCLKCASVLCSRFVKGHMLAHYEEVHHALAISFSDLSFWCYLCDSYVESPQLSTLLRHFQTVKFGEDIEQVVSSLQSLKVEEAKEEEKKEEKKEEPASKPQLRLCLDLQKLENSRSLGSPWKKYASKSKQEPSSALPSWLALTRYILLFYIRSEQRWYQRFCRNP